MESDPEDRIVPVNSASYGEQDENGVDLSLIRESLKLTPLERLRKADRAWRDAVRLMEYGRRNREKPARTDR